MVKRIICIALCAFMIISGAVYAEITPEKASGTVKTLVSKGVMQSGETHSEGFVNNTDQRLPVENNADTRYTPYIPEGSEAAYRVKYGKSKTSRDYYCYYGYLFNDAESIKDYDINSLSLSMYIMPLRSTTNNKYVAVNQSLYDNFEVGLICKSQNEFYSSVRIKVSDYLPVPALPVAADASWYRVEIPFSDILENGTFYDDCGEGLSEFDTDNLCGVRFATKAEPAADNAFVFVMVDELKIVQSLKTPYDLTIDSTEPTSVSFSWSDDNQNIDGYNIFRNDIFIGQTTEKSYTDTDLKPLTEYSYKVQAVSGDTKSGAEEILITTADYFANNEKYAVTFGNVAVNGATDLSSAYLSDGNLKIEGKIKSNTYDGELFAAGAYFEGNSMKDLAVLKLYASQNGEADFSLDLQVSENGYVKFFVLDKFESLNLLSQTCLFDKSGLYIVDSDGKSGADSVKMSFNSNTSEFIISTIPDGLSITAIAHESVNLSEIDETNAKDKIAYINVPGAEISDGSVTALIDSEKFQDGYYVAYLAERGGNKLYKSDKEYFASQATISNIFGVVNNESATESDIINAVTNPVLGFDLTDYNRVKAYDKSIARLIKEYRTADIASAGELNKIFDKAVGTVIMMTSAKIEDAEKYAEMLELDSEIMTILKSEDTSKNVISAMFALIGKTEPKADDITLENAKLRFKETYVCAAAGDSETTWADLEKLITKYALADLTKITSAGLEKSDVLKEMLGRSYTVSEDFEKNLASAITAVTNSNTSNSTPKRSGSGGGGGGGLKVSTPIVPDTDDTPNNTEADNGIFADIKTSHWAYQSVLSLVNKNIISKDTNFRPNDYITREEFAKIISVVFEPIADKYPNFVDVDASSWYAPYINSVYSADLVKGISENKFGVGLNITREDMAVIIFRALKAEDKEYDVNFADKDEVSDYALNAVGYLNANGLLNGDNGKVYAKNNATRAECCVLVNNLLEYLGK